MTGMKAALGKRYKDRADAIQRDFDFQAGLSTT